MLKNAAKFAMKFYKNFSKLWLGICLLEKFVENIIKISAQEISNKIDKNDVITKFWFLISGRQEIQDSTKCEQRTSRNTELSECSFDAEFDGNQNSFPAPPNFVTEELTEKVTTNTTPMSLSASSSSTAIGSSSSDISSATYTPSAKPSQISYTTKSSNAYPLASKSNGHNISASFGINSHSAASVSSGRPSSGRSSNISVRPSSADSFASCNSNTTTFSIIKVLYLMSFPYRSIKLNLGRSMFTNTRWRSWDWSWTWKEFWTCSTCWNCDKTI